MKCLQRLWTHTYKCGNKIIIEHRKGHFLKFHEISLIRLLSNRNYSSVKEFVVRSPYPDISIPNKSFTELIWGRHEKWKNLTAVECGISGLSYTYSELLMISEKIGRGLLNEGLKPGEVVAFLLPNMPDYIAAILGAARVGLTICSINPLYTKHEIAYQIKNSGAKCLITFPDKLDEALQSIEDLYSDKLKENIKVISTRRLDRRETSLPRQVKPLEQIINNVENDNYMSNVSKNTYTNLAFIAHSSGTTGLPKGVALTHKNVTASILQMSYHQTTCFKETTGSYQDVVPIVLPIFHNFALELVLDCLYHGSKIITLPKFEEETFLINIKYHKASVLFTVPPMMLFLSSNEKVTKKHLKHVRLIFCAAAPIGADDISRTMEKAPSDSNFVQGYGQTEAMCCLSHTPYGLKNYKSVGVPLVNTEMKVVDVENGTSKPPFQEGEICFRGPQMSLGYLNDPKKTSEAIDNDGWFHTGDIGYYDKDSHFYIVDRIKDMIKVKGYQVAPAELEAVLRNHPAIEDTGVVGVPHDRKGESPVAFVKVKPNTKVSEEELKAFISGKVAPFKAIEQFIFIDSIPKNPSGKILRKNLKMLLKN